MQKVYLLLRNNLQTGPFSVDELLQHELKPTDLVWEEGRSAGWSFPYEISSLRPFLHLETPTKKESNQHKVSPQEFSPTDMDAPFASKSVTSKNVYVSLPGHNSLHKEDEPKQESIEESLEQKADAIRKRAFAALEHERSNHNGVSQPEQKSVENPYELETKLSRSTDEIGEDYSAWLYTQQIEKKKKARRKRSILMGVSTVSLVAVGFFLYKGIIINDIGITAESQPTQESKPNDEVQTKIQHTQKVKEPVSNDSSTQPAPDSNSVVSLHSVPLEPGRNMIKSAHNQNVTIQKPIENLAKSETKVDTNHEVKPLPVADTEQTESKKAPEVIATTPKKKQTFGDKIGNFFDKFKSKDKKNQPENSKDQPENSEVKTGQVPAERGSKHRSEPAPNTTNIANLISVSSNAPSESWMMGVQGLKLTLHNKSNETVKTAAVEVRYYNEDKDLLEKKVVYFNNISPKASQTVAAPDHRLAERADFQLVSAVAKEDGYVKQ